MKIEKIWIIFGVFFLAAAQTIYYQNNQIKILKEIEQLSEKAIKIDKDQIRDLIYASAEEKNKNEEIATRNYIAGIIDCMNRREHYQEIWHEGFDRGMENKRIIEEAEKLEKVSVASQKK